MFCNQISPRHIFCFLLLTFLFLCCNKKGVNAEEKANNDSINKYLKLAGDDALPMAARDRHNQKAFSFIDLRKNDTLVRWYLCETARYCNVTKNTLQYKKISRIHYNKSFEAKDTLNLARFYRHRAAHHKLITKLYDSTFYYYSKAEKLYKKTSNYSEFASLCFFKGSFQLDMDDYLGAQLSNKLAFSIIKNVKPCRLTYQILTDMANIEHNLQNYDTAIIVHKKALELASDLRLSTKKYKYNFINTSLNNIGNSYKEQKKFKKAISHFEQAIANKFDFQSDPLIFAYLYANLGYCKMQLKQYDEVPSLLKMSIRIFDSLKIKKNECAISHVYLSDYYGRQKDSAKSILHSQKALKLAKQAKAPYYYLIALAHAGSVNKDKAPQYIKDYHRINDSLQFEQRKARSQFYKIQLETNEIVKEKEKAIQQKWVIASIISGVLLIVILLFIIYRQRARQKELRLRQIQQKSNEEIYQLMLTEHAKVEEARQVEKNRIALELHDGVMNKLASTRMNLFVLSKKNDSQTIANCLAYIEDIHDIENEIRNLSHNLSKEVTDTNKSFNLLMQQLVKSQNIHSDTEYKLKIEKAIDWETISNEIKMHIYRIVQESLNNINKYAMATHAGIDFSIRGNHLAITISDNGIGFDPEKTKDGIGLKNIQQRIALLSGQLRITSEPNKGTTLHLSLPV